MVLVFSFLCTFSLVNSHCSKAFSLSINLLFAHQLQISPMSVRQRRPSTTGVIADAAKNLEKKIENALTVLWDDLPSWQQDNHYIHSGYRPASSSFKKSFASLGYIHNESVNIYSHFIGAVIFSTVAIVLYTAIKPRYESAAPSDVLAFACFFAGAALCLGMSGTYHTISNHSPTINRMGNKLDYVGIVFLITGSFIPSVFYGFYCHPHLQEFYWTMVSFSATLPYHIFP
jgi:adiponectin receptor